MKNMFKLLLAALLVFAAACEKPQPDPEPDDTIVLEPVDTTATENYLHALVLNEGPQGNMASLSYLDLAAGTIENHWFSIHNGRELGDVAQDLIVYGTKAYVTVWGSGCLEAIDTATGIATHVDLGNRGPRYMAADGGKLYVTCYNPAGIIRIDTATLQVEATCLLGAYNPEGIAIAAGKLFAVSSWIGEAQSEITYDDKVYVVDMATFANPTPIVVGKNPQNIMAVDDNHLVVNCWGEWNMDNGSTEGDGSAIIDANTLAVTQTGQLLTKMTVADGKIFGYASTYDASWNMTTTFLRIDLPSMAVSTILPGCGINNPYAIAVHPVSGNIYIGTDGNYATNGDLYCFTPDGTRLWKREVGMLPSKVVFLKSEK